MNRTGLKPICVGVVILLGAWRNVFVSLFNSMSRASQLPAYPFPVATDGVGVAACIPVRNVWFCQRDAFPLQRHDTSDTRDERTSENGVQCLFIGMIAHNCLRLYLYFQHTKVAIRLVGVC